MSVYVVADANFGFSENRDKTIIEKWNRVVREDDLVVLFGDIGYKGTSWEHLVLTFNKLHGIKKIIGVDKNDPEAENWRALTGKKCFKMNGAVPGEIDGKSCVIVIYTSKDYFPSIKELKNGDVPCASAKSISGQKEVFENNVLSLSIEDWDYTPIEYVKISELVDNMILFSKMENEEVNLNEN